MPSSIPSSPLYGRSIYAMFHQTKRLLNFKYSHTHPQISFHQAKVRSGKTEFLPTCRRHFNK